MPKSIIYNAENKKNIKLNIKTEIILTSYNLHKIYLAVLNIFRHLCCWKMCVLYCFQFTAKEREILVLFFSVIFYFTSENETKSKITYLSILTFKTLRTGTEIRFFFKSPFFKRPNLNLNNNFFFWKYGISSMNTRQCCFFKN